MCHISAPHDLSSFSVLPLCLLCLSERLPLPPSEALSNVFFLRGFLKGHRGEETFSAAHACQMWCSKDDAEGEEEEDEEAVEETELKV